MAKKSNQFKIQSSAGVKVRKTHKASLAVVISAALIVLLAAGGFFAYTKWFQGDKTEVAIARFESRSDVDDQPVSQTQKDEYVVAANKPRYMTIPKLSVSQARVQEMGVLANNQLDAPQSVNDAGWYKKSALPGSGDGAGLYDGHNTGPNERGVFWDLASLQQGDEIIIERGDGQKFTYKVAEVEQTPLEQVDMAKLLQSAEPGEEGLSIITCSGNWIPEQNTFDHRTTVRAVRES